MAEKELTTTVKFLDMQEEKWLQEHKKSLRVGITQIPNQVLLTEEGYRGYAIDIFNKISDILHIEFEYIYFPTWKELLKAGEKRLVDIVFMAQKTQKRLQYYNFTDTVLLQHNKIITNSADGFGVDVEDLYNKEVAVVQGSALFEYIQRNFSKIKLIATNSETDSLTLLLENKVNFTIVEPVRMSYYMKKENIDSLYISGFFPYDYKLRIASRNDLPILNIILNKAIEHIPTKEKKALALKWGYEKETNLNKELFFKIFFVFLFVLLFVIYLYFLNRKLYKTQKLLNKMNNTLYERIDEEVQKNREKELIMLNQSRLAQMGQVLNMIAHQWRQPLNNLRLVNQTLVLRYKKQKGILKYQEVEEFEKNSTMLIQQMSETIDDFRDFFKPSKSKVFFDLNEIIENLLKLVQPVVENLSIKLLFSKSSECILKGYPNEVAQAVLNIIYNAKDVIEERGIQKGKINIRIDCSSEFVKLSICDNAGGIKEEIIEHIFDPYFSTKNRNGTGLGLYMSKVIVEKHMNGELTLINTSKGAKFIICFPRSV